MSKKFFTRTRKVPTRVRGLVLFGVSCALGYLSVVSPLLEASWQAPKITMHLTGAVITPMLFGISISFIIFGEKAKAVLGAPPDSKPSSVGWVFYIVSWVIGLGLYFWLKMQLRAYGYSA